MNREKTPVLLVDDRPENLTALEALLADLDLEMVKALSGNEALRSILKADFALVLLDVQMPDMDGFETAELMRANPKTRHLPIIFVTAGMKEERFQFKGYETGAVDYLMKPIEPAILRSKVKVFTELYQQRRDLESRERNLEETVKKRTAALEDAMVQLDQSRDRYQRLLESVTNYVFTVTIENDRPVRTLHRDACSIVTGFTSNEYDDQPDLWFRMVFEEDRPMVMEASHKILTATKPVCIEHRICHKNGSLRWVRNTLVPYRDSGDILRSYDGIIEDISERKWAEVLLNRWAHLFEHAKWGIAIESADGRTIDLMNPAFAEMHGYTVPELTGKPVQDVTAPESVSEICAQTGKAQSQGYALFEARHLRRNGTSFPVSVEMSAVRDAAGTVLYHAVNVQDITERTKAAEALFKSEKRYRMLFEQAGDYILVLESSEQKGLVIVDANHAACEMHGYTRDELIGMPITAIDVNIDPSTIRMLLQKALFGETLHFETVHRKKDGTLFPVEVTSKQLEEIAGPRLYLSIERDITSRKKLEEQLRQSQKMEAIGILAGGIAHDFNNILSAIVGYGSLLRMKLKPTDQLQQYVDQLLASTERAAGLTKSLLAFSRKQPMELGSVNINTLVQGFQKIITRIIGEDIEFQVQCSPEALMVQADKGQIEQVLMNLVVNSRDAMPKGGSLRIITDRVTIDEDRGDMKKGVYAAVSVSDTGVGMDSETQEHIFEPFYTTKEVGKGTGLGLAIVYGIVKKHNGDVQVQSEREKGTTITVFLPLSQASTKELASEGPVTIPRGAETILLVEDDVPTRIIAKVLLEEFGYTVLEAVDGDHAISVFRDNCDRIKLVVCDLIMPKKNGLEALEEIRTIRPDIRSLFTSGYTMNIIAQEARLKEGVNFISKPLNPTDLLTKIRKVLDARE